MSNEFKNKIDDLVSLISRSYDKEERIAPYEQGFIPNRSVIIETTKLLRQLVFPSYFSDTHFRKEIQDYHISELAVSITEKMTEQITLTLKHNSCVNQNGNISDCQSVAENLCCTFMKKIPEIREFLATDVQAAFDGDPAAQSKDEVIFCYPGVFAISIHRLAHELYKLSVPMIPRIMSEYAHNITGIDIHPGATIGKYFFIDHGTGVVIGETAVIGEHVKIYQGVTLGALSTRGGQKLRGVRRHPCLKDEVTVYSGASILGGETVIGKGVVIGSNVFITKSVPEDTKVSIKNMELHFSGGKPNKDVKDDSINWDI